MGVPMNSRWQSGQVGLAVVLIMVVMSTIGISLATRATRDVRTARQSQEATQTFSAAESALEDILSKGQTFLDETTTGQFSGVENVAVNYSVARETQLTTQLLEGGVAEINVAGGTAGQRVIIEWGDSASCGQDPASLALSIVNTSSGTPVSRYETYAICDRGDGFTVANTTGTTYARRIEVTLQNGDQTIRVATVYNDTQLLVNGDGWTLPTQQYTINSVARNELGRETKAIEVQRTNEFAPTILDYSLVSGTTITKP